MSRDNKFSQRLKNMFITLYFDYLFEMKAKSLTIQKDKSSQTCKLFGDKLEGLDKKKQKSGAGNWLVSPEAGSSTNSVDQWEQKVGEITNLIPLNEFG